MKTRKNPFPPSVQFSNKRYYKGLIDNDGCLYYVDYKEGDENASVLCYSKEGKLLSDNYFAFSAMFEAIENNTYTWASRTMKYQIKVQKEIETRNNG